MKEVIRKSEELLRGLDHLDKFSRRFEIYPYNRAKEILEGMRILSEEIPYIESPQNKKELIQKELKTRLEKEASRLEFALSGKYYDFNEVVSQLLIPEDNY